MPKINPDTNDPAPVANIIEQTLANIVVTTQPVVICGVNRKVNIGNFETVDVYAGVALPLGSVSIEDQAQLREVLTQAAAMGFELVSREANERYNLLKG